ncbi:hypothetical protein DMB42_04900 [Nonomuraea sp. WAC 01424]|nr:hypothetical protein DMB42_04900 [Nonomuraea sp. WAC 01424]
MIDGIGIRLLGPVTGVLGDAEIDLGAARQRAVVAMLASPPGRVVTKGRLVEGLWGDDAPPSAEQSVYTYVAGLRRALEPGREPGRRSTVLVGEAGGYRLLLAPRQVDSCLFTELVEEARLLDPGRGDDALRVLEQALSLWRGVALSGLAGPFAEAERSRLEQLFLSATEARAETLLRLGRQREAITALQDLVGRHPLREHLHELLVLALHGADRQAEALLAYERARRTLDEELGVLPGEGLRAAHRVVLSGGAEEPPSATTSVPRQLPRDLIGFVGRSEEVARLRSLLAPEAGPPHPVVAVSGPPGVGKSALAVHVGHAVEDRFPDGQLAIALRGGTPGVAPLPAHEIAGRLLRGIGTSNEDIPVDVDEAAAMWRSRLHGRRLLVLLDDAAGLTQIRPFLGTPLGVSVLVTSRESFTAGDDCVQPPGRPPGLDRRRTGRKARRRTDPVARAGGGRSRGPVGTGGELEPSHAQRPRRRAGGRVRAGPPQRRPPSRTGRSWSLPAARPRPGVRRGAGPRRGPQGPAAAAVRLLRGRLAVGRPHRGPQPGSPDAPPGGRAGPGLPGRRRGERLDRAGGAHLAGRRGAGHGRPGRRPRAYGGRPRPGDALAPAEGLPGRRPDLHREPGAVGGRAPRR